MYRDLAAGGCYASVSEAPLDPSLQLADLSDGAYREMCQWHAESEGLPGRFTTDLGRSLHAQP
ncbi:MAG: hypothetical protein RLP09_14135, partial [Sandaracinaceae bacterium]